jgi:hypothetical protein
MVRKILLACGILAALLYVGSDILAALLWQGYSYSAQSVSELRAIGAPTRGLLMPILTLYSLLEIAFGIGVWQSAAGKWPLKVTALLLIALGTLDLSGYFFPLHLGEAVDASANSLHIFVTALTVLMILLVIGFGSTADGKWFHLYSIATIVLLIVTGALTFMELPRIEAGLPTPWMGVRERINIYGYMLWMVMLAIVLWRPQGTVDKEKLTGTSLDTQGSGQLSQSGQAPVNT